MSGQTNLVTLLRTMTPILNPGEYVFCLLGEHLYPAPTDVISSFQEAEGMTLIVRREAADRLGLPYSFVAAWLMLTVHSSLTAVGLTAAVAQALTNENISCNVVAAYYHDHLFVAQDDAGRTLAALERLASNY